MFSGRTAAWLHELESAFPEPIEVTLPSQHPIKARVGLRITRVRLRADEITVKRGWRVTSTLRTLLDLARRLPLTDAVTLTDAALYRRQTTMMALEAAAKELLGTRHVRRVRAVLTHAEARSESHMESQLRMLLVNAGLPRPLAQVDLKDAAGRSLGRADLYYPSHRLALEYDGGTHRTSLIQDNRRQNQILAAGYAIRRFTFADVHGSPQKVVALIRGDLVSRPPVPNPDCAA